VGIPWAGGDWLGELSRWLMGRGRLFWTWWISTGWPSHGPGEIIGDLVNISQTKPPHGPGETILDWVEFYWVVKSWTGGDY